MAGRKPGFKMYEAQREKIQAAQIINRLHGCVMGTVEMSTQQVNAAKTLLNKVLPDLSSVDSNVNANVTGNITFNTVYERSDD